MIECKLYMSSHCNGALKADFFHAYQIFKMATTARFNFYRWTGKLNKQIKATDMTEPKLYMKGH